MSQAWLLYAGHAPAAAGRARDAQFACGCWLSAVGCQRHPAVTGTLCCPVHLLPYPALLVHFALVAVDDADT